MNRPLIREKIFVVLAIIAFAVVAYATKTVNYTTTKINTMTVQSHANGDAVCKLQGTIFDSEGSAVKDVSMSLTFDDLPAQVRMNLNNVMKHMSREMNNYGADEDSETWVEP